MNNQDRFIEWYTSRINPRTGKMYKEGSARTYVNYLGWLVKAHLVGGNIFDVDLAEFDRQINEAQQHHAVQFAALENHSNLKNAVVSWREFLAQS